MGAYSGLSSGHTGANRSVDLFRECFYSSLTLTELRSRMQTGFCVPILYYTGTLVCSTVLLHHPRADKNTPK